MLKQLVSYCLVGVLNTAIGLSVIFLLKGVFSLADVTANLAGYSVGLCVSFVLNKRSTFRHDGEWVATAFRFAAVILVAYCANLATMLSAIHLGVDSYVAHLVGNIPYTAIGFVGSRYFVFRRIPAQDKELENVR